MRILILGGDGYLGWPTALHFSARTHDVVIVDSFLRRQAHLERGTESLTPIRPLHERIKAWRELSGKEITYHVGDTQDGEFISRVIREFRPEAIIHYGEMPSAPYSMVDVAHAIRTQANNVLGTLNVLFAMRDYAPSCHLVKLGTMGEYGTPNIDIEEGFIEIEHKGRKDRLPFPKQAGSFYHLSKVHDSNNIMFTCRTWGLCATDLNQGIVYGIETEETGLDERMITRYDYDEIFGTVLNRFCVQAVAGLPLTIYGSGEQTRGFLNIKDTLQCVELAVLNPPGKGEFRVFNQFTEQFSVNELAKRVAREAKTLGIHAKIEYVASPRVEAQKHHYNAVHTGLLELGLKPHLLSDNLVRDVMQFIQRYRERIDERGVMPRTAWNPSGQRAEAGAKAAQR